jgi:soluble epoxide hydrolase/lipid-phosphate phosphatase
VEKSVKDEQSIRQFLKGMYGARGPKGELAFVPEKGVVVENLPVIGESKILNGKVSDTVSIFLPARLKADQVVREATAGGL